MSTSPCLIFLPVELVEITFQTSSVCRHRVKNASTRNWKSVDTLRRRWTILITATPSLNTINVACNPEFLKAELKLTSQQDLLALARLLWPSARQHMQDTTWEHMEQTIRTVLDLEKLKECAYSDDLRLSACHPGL